MKAKWVVLVLGLGLWLTQPAWSEEHREHVDVMHGHNRSYPVRETRFEHIPVGARHLEWRGEHYWWHDGVWYRPWGGAYVVVGAPIGLYVPLVPAFATAVVIGGISYYYANETYYLFHPESNQYEVVAPPVAAAPSVAPASAAMAQDVFVYPRNGQSAEQTAKDRYECHAWAVSQTGFDPTVAGSGGRRADYQRAQAACLEGRGYTVK